MLEGLQFITALTVKSVSRGSERSFPVGVIKCVVLVLMEPELLDQAKERFHGNAFPMKHTVTLCFLFLGVQMLTDEEATQPSSKWTPIAGRNLLELKI